MAVMTQEQITLSSVTDIMTTCRYYLLQDSALAAPTKPTIYPPASPWVKTEPTYTAGSTKSLYFVDCTLFSDETFAYTDVSMSSSYEASKVAYGKAVEAKEIADAAQKAADDAKKNADNAEKQANAAQLSVSAANAELALAKANLASLESRTDATEEEIAAAKSAVASAEAAANAAKATADQAKTNADNAKTAADNAQELADALAGRMAIAEAQIIQNAEQIELRATKVEVAKTLEGYYTATETEAAITTKAGEITSEVSANYTKKTDFNNLQIGGRNFLFNSKGDDCTNWIYAGTIIADAEKGYCA